MAVFDQVNSTLVFGGILVAGAIYVGSNVAKWLSRGISFRRQVRSLGAQGAPVLKHSFLFGHLPIFDEFRRAHPPDVSIYEFPNWLMKNVSRLFPGQTTVPAVVHLDIWPLVSEPMIMVTDAAVMSSFTQVKNLLKSNAFAVYMAPLTQNKDIVSLEGDAWKTWRSRLNPGFSTRNITALLPELAEEAVVFLNVLKKLAGPDGTWGPVFQFEEKTTNLTFDVIVRAVLDTRLNEQTRDSPSPLKVAMIDQLEQMGRMANPTRGFLHSFTAGRSVIERNNKAMRDFLLPKIEAKFDRSTRTQGKKTVVDLALKQFDDEKAGGGSSGDANVSHVPDPEFLDTLLSNVKVFLFAGHDTTATTLCWMFKALQAHPAALARLRAEHDAVLGPDAAAAVDVILASPHLLFALPYTLGVIKETLRLWPLAATMRRGNAGFFLDVGGDDLAAADSSSPPVRHYPTDGWDLWDGSLVLQTDPARWARGREFVPERWLVPEGDPLHPPRDSWRPFELGPRNCIGQELAMTELRLVAVLVARQLDIEPAWDEWDQKQGNTGPPPMISGERLYRVGTGTVHPKDGMPVHVRLRQAS